MVLSEKILRCIADGVITTDNVGVISYMNPVAEHLTGHTADDSVGKRFNDIVKIERDDDGRTVLRDTNNDLTSNHIAILYSIDGQRYSVSYSMTALKDENSDSTGFVIVMHDITKEYDLAQKLMWQAEHDSLTGLKNRRAFERHVKDLLAINSEQQKAVLLFMDLDHFKAVNDTSGHQTGDLLLKHVSSKLGAQLRASDQLSRLGGDEFAIVLDRCATDRAIEIANRIRDAIVGLDFTADNQTFKIGISIGVVPVGGTLQTYKDVLWAGDMACYTAKNKGGNTVHLYDDSDNTVIHKMDQMSWLNDLQNALEHESFELYWQQVQPCHDDTEYTYMYEFLVRLKLQEGALIIPGEFISVAERYGLMPKLDRWVIKQAFSIITRLADNQNALYNINLSGQSLTDETLLSYTLEQLVESGVNPEIICFEITETTIINSFTTARHFIDALRKKGCKFALDDFGTGASSFTYLKHFTVDFIKIDGEFIKHLNDDPVDQAIVHAAQTAAADLGIATIAEWVENDDIQVALQKMNIDYVQGNHIGRPERVG